MIGANSTCPRRRRRVLRSGDELGEVAGDEVCGEDRGLPKVLAVLGVLGGEAVELGDGLDVALDGVGLASEQEWGASVSGSCWTVRARRS
jgi:hypothetical protein